MNINIDVCHCTCCQSSAYPIPCIWYTNTQINTNTYSYTNAHWYTDNEKHALKRMILKEMKVGEKNHRLIFCFISVHICAVVLTVETMKSEWRYARPSVVSNQSLLLDVLLREAFAYTHRYLLLIRTGPKVLSDQWGLSNIFKFKLLSTDMNISIFILLHYNHEIECINMNISMSIP